MDLHERADPVEARVGLYAADRADVPRHERRGLLAPLRDDRDVRRQVRKGVALQVRPAAGDVDAAVDARGARGSLAALRDGLARDAAGADHRNLGVDAFGVPVAQERLAHLAHVGVRDLAAEEVDAERRHGPDVRRFGRP